MCNGSNPSDFDERAGTLAVTGKVVRITGEGLIRVDETKTAAGRRTIALPSFAVDALRQRRSLRTWASIR